MLFNAKMYTMFRAVISCKLPHKYNHIITCYNELVHHKATIHSFIEHSFAVFSIYTSICRVSSKRNCNRLHSFARMFVGPFIHSFIRWLVTRIGIIFFNGKFNGNNNNHDADTNNNNNNNANGIVTLMANCV